VQENSKLPRGILLPRREDVGVDAKGYFDLLMAESLGHNVDRHTGFEQQGCALCRRPCTVIGRTPAALMTPANSR
jgi:hypothetical protein